MRARARPAVVTRPQAHNNHNNTTRSSITASIPHRINFKNLGAKKPSSLSLSSSAPISHSSSRSTSSALFSSSFRLPTPSFNFSQLKFYSAEPQLSTLPRDTGRKYRRVGRGPGSTKGKTCARGHKGQKARNKVPPGFEGGQTPVFRRVGKHGFTNNFKKTWDVINLFKIQQVIDQGRLDPSETITIRTLKDLGLIGNVKHGVKLLSDGKEVFSAKINLEISQASQAAREAVEKAGGKVTTVYFNRLGLYHYLRKPHDEIKIKFARAPRKKQPMYDVPSGFKIPGYDTADQQANFEWPDFDALIKTATPTAHAAAPSELAVESQRVTPASPVV